MTMDKHQDYLTLLEELRHRYKLRYGSILDDEILFLIIRINELQVDLKKEVKAINRLHFPTGFSYLLYGLGRSISYFLAGIGLLTLAITIYLNSTPTPSRKYEYVRTPAGIAVFLEAFSGKDTMILLESGLNKKKK